MGDDGLGVVVAQRLRPLLDGVDGVEILDGGTWGMQLLPSIEDAARLLVIDAVHAGALPGTVIRLGKEDLPRLLYQKVSPHQIDLREVFAVAELRGRFPREAVALGIQPDVVELRHELSPVVRRGLPELMDAIADQLRTWGHDLPEGASVRA
jgi:hydrogenase maturation protease